MHVLYELCFHNNKKRGSTTFRGKITTRQDYKMEELFFVTALRSRSIIFNKLKGASKQQKQNAPKQETRCPG